MIPESTAFLVNDLRDLRNEAVHGREFDPSLREALEHSELAEGVTTRITPRSANDLIAGADNTAGLGFGARSAASGW